MNYNFSIRWNSRYVPLFVFVSNHSSSCLLFIQLTMLFCVSSVLDVSFLQEKKMVRLRKMCLFKSTRTEWCLCTLNQCLELVQSVWQLGSCVSFQPRYIAMKLDRGLCQQSALCRGEFLGSAESCWIPIYVNLALGIFLNLLCENLFANIQMTRKLLGVGLNLLPDLLQWLFLLSFLKETMKVLWASSFIMEHLSSPFAVVQ